MGGLFNEFEDYEYCITTWFSTIAAYYSTAIIDAPKFMGLLFSFSWIHSVYPFYPLCVTQTNGVIDAYGVDSTDGVTVFTCGSSAQATCASECGGSASAAKKSDPWCYD